LRQKKNINFDNIHETFDEIDKISHAFLCEIKNSIRNYSFVPSNSTIRLEYVRCGKSNCNTCSDYFNYLFNGHGPYYYAYFRDKENQGRLKKKYIGQYDPRDSSVREFLSTLRDSDSN